MVPAYETVGVDTVGMERSLQSLGKPIAETFAFNAAKPLLPLGYFANVVPLAPDVALAISTDGVGTKILVAQEVGKYDTVGIDCVAMNANDILCVGARPVSIVDYIAVQRADAALLEAIARGLCQGAQTAGINIPGGEIAQVREMVRGCRDGYGFDLVGTCVGTVKPDELIVGQHIEPGDLVVGIASSGIHSNGLTLARHALFDEGGLRAGDVLPELGRSVGEELLEPTHIYVRGVLAMLDAGLAITALIHITGDGFLNLARVAARVGFVIDRPLDPPPVFSLIQRFARVDDVEMFRIYNMGTGFCVIVAPDDAARVQAVAGEHGHHSAIIGYAVADAQRRIWIPPRGLIGQGKQFHATNDPTPSNPRG